MNRWTIFALALSMVVGCGRTAPRDTDDSSESRPDELAKLEVGDFEVGDPIQHGNLTIFPVTSRSPRNDDRFITLDEGLKAGTIEILEVGGQAANAPPNPSRPQDQNIDDSSAPSAPAVPSTDCDDDESNEDQPPADNPPPDNSPADSPGNGNGNDLPNTNLPAIDDENDRDPFDESDDSLNDDSPNVGNALEFNVLQSPGQPGGNSVNQLLVLNRSDKPLYLMPGEVIIGGSQDRTIGQEIVIAPSDKPVPIEVYCVEQGRWNQRDVNATVQFLSEAAGNDIRRASVAVRPDKKLALAAKANQGQFIATIGSLNKSARLAANSLDATSEKQANVWKSVKHGNTASGVFNDTDTFTDQYASDKVVARLDPYIAALQNPVLETGRVVGVVVAINGKVEQTDVFESTPLFRKLWPKLLKSYAVDAANAANSKDADKTCTRGDACAFMNSAMQTQVDGSQNNDKIAFTQRSNPSVVTYSAVERAPNANVDTNPNAAADPSGGLGDSVHFSGFSK